MKIIGCILLSIFYAVYLGKMILQKRKGIRTDQMAKGKEKGKSFYIELILKTATYSVVAAEVISIFAVTPSLPDPLIVIGIILAFAGDIVFAAAVVTMRDSWRAGIAVNDRVYLGLLLMFFNIPLLLFSILAMAMLHLQILQEEKYLAGVFGEEYVAYRNRVCRYLGWKRKNLV